MALIVSVVKMMSHKRGQLVRLFGWRRSNQDVAMDGKAIVFESEESDDLG